LFARTCWFESGLGHQKIHGFSDLRNDAVSALLRNQKRIRASYFASVRSIAHHTVPEKVRGGQSRATRDMTLTLATA